MSNIDKYKDIDDVRKNVKAKKGSMGEMIESFESDKTPIIKKKSNKVVPKEKPKELGREKRQRQLDEAIKMLEPRSKGYVEAEKEGFTHTNKAKSFNDDGDMDD